MKINRRYRRNIRENLYNSVLSEESLSLDDSIVASEISSESIEDQMQTIMNEMGAIIYALIVIGEPDDIVNAFLFLASDMASYVTGEVLSVDGAMRS